MKNLALYRIVFIVLGDVNTNLNPTVSRRSALVVSAFGECYSVVASLRLKRLKKELLIIKTKEALTLEAVQVYPMYDFCKVPLAIMLR